MPNPGIAQNAALVDFSGRIAVSTAVVASPAAASETVIANVTIPLAAPRTQGVILSAWATYTVGTSGTAVTLQIRQTGLAGTSIVSTGAMTGSQHGAGIVSQDDVYGVDTAPPSAGVYALTMTVANGAATSTVSAVYFEAVVL